MVPWTSPSSQAGPPPRTSGRDGVRIQRHWAPSHVGAQLEFLQSDAQSLTLGRLLNAVIHIIPR